MESIVIHRPEVAKYGMGIIRKNILIFPGEGLDRGEVKKRSKIAEVHYG